MTDVGVHASRRIVTVLGRAAEVEITQPFGAVFLALGDFVEISFEPGGELVVHKVIEVLFEQLDHRERQPAGNERVAARGDVAAVLDGGDDGRVGRRTADAELFHALDQAGFRKARRRCRGVPVGFHAVDRQGVAFFDVRQSALVLFVRAIALEVLAFFVGGEESLERDDGAACGQFGAAAAAEVRVDPHGRGRTLGIGHLRCNGALPDEFVELEFVTAQLTRNLGRRAEVVTGGANGFVGFLRALLLGGVDARLRRHEFGAVELAHLTASSRKRFR